MITTNTSKLSLVLELNKLVKASSTIKLHQIKSYFLYIVGELLDEFSKSHFQDELKKINSQSTLFQRFSKNKFKNKQIVFSNLFTDGVNKAIEELQFNSKNGIVGFVSKKYGISNYEKYLLHTLNSTIFYNVKRGTLIMKPIVGETVALFNLASVFLNSTEILDEIKVELDCVKEYEGYTKLCLTITNKQEILESLFVTVEKFIENFFSTKLKELTLENSKFVNELAIKFAPSEFVAKNLGYTFEYDNLDEDELTIVSKVNNFDSLLLYSYPLNCPYHLYFYQQARSFYYDFSRLEFKQKELFIGFKKASEMNFKNWEKILEGFKSTYLKFFSAEYSTWLDDLNFNQKPNNSNVQTLNENFFNLF